MDCHKPCLKPVLLFVVMTFLLFGQRVFAQSYDNNGYSDYQENDAVLSGTNVCPFIEGSLLKSPYVAAIRVGVDYLFTGVLYPFYFGIGVRGDLGFPQEDFPYTYSYQGSELGTPVFVGGTAYVPLGVAFSPMENERIQFLIELRAGVAMGELVTLGTNAASGFHVFPYAGLAVGVIIYGFELSVFSEYDSLNTFTQGVKISYRIPLKFGGKSYE